MNVDATSRRRLGWPIATIAALALCMSAAPAFAFAFTGPFTDEPAPLNELPPLDELAADHDRDRLWNITGYVGQLDDSRFVEILSLRGFFLEPSYIGGGSIGRRFATSFDDDLHWELEGSVFRHWGQQHHWEGNVTVIARWTRLPWDHYVDTSLAFGSGMSYAGQRPPVEGDTRRLLHHLLAEVELAPFDDVPLSFVGRVHHRSGVYGLYGAKGGTNYLTAGVRYRF